MRGAEGIFRGGEPPQLDTELSVAMLRTSRQLRRHDRIKNNYLKQRTLISYFKSIPRREKCKGN